MHWIDPDLFEFHLSYRDLSLDPRPFLEETHCTRLIVHAPELFEHSELLDLAADDETYRRRSIDNLKRVVAATETIADFFPRADSLLIVANVGGFSGRPLFRGFTTSALRTISRVMRGRSISAVRS